MCPPLVLQLSHDLSVTKTACKEWQCEQGQEYKRCDSHGCSPLGINDSEKDVGGRSMAGEGFDVSGCECGTLGREKEEVIRG